MIEKLTKKMKKAKKKKAKKSKTSRRQPHRCQYVFTKGESEGKVCSGASALKDDGEPWGFCICHLPYVGTMDKIGAIKPIQVKRKADFLETRCVYVFTCGKAKGTRCDRKKIDGLSICKLHKSYKNKNNPEFKGAKKRRVESEESESEESESESEEESESESEEESESDYE